MATKTRNQPLPPKEEGLFKQVVKLYESKQFKKGIKTADQILKKFPEHGETLAMKGLIVNNLPDRHDEAHALVRAALKADIKSYVCWHVYGILHRSDRVYDQAAKSYMNALKWDPDNLQICRDLSQLQMQLRDIKGLVDTATKMLALKPTPRNHWMLLAIAHHLDKNYSVAVQVIDAYLDTQENDTNMSTLDRVEMGEIEMYKATILAEAGDVNGALEVLTARNSHICDRVGNLEMQGKLYMQKGMNKEAETVYRKLIGIIPDNYNYHRGLCAALELPDNGAQASDTVVERLTSVYASVRETVKDCSAAERIPLDFLTGDDFVAAARERLQKFVRKGIPSLYSDLRPLLDNPAKSAALWKEASSLLEDASAESAEAVWLRLYLARHAAHDGRLGEAFAQIHAAEESPAVPVAAVELYMAKADILDEAGDAPGAAAAAEVARKLDVKDRYMNSVAAKYLFRAGQLAKAKSTALLFARDTEDGANNLFDMQVMWYELESGQAHLAAGNLGMALKMFNSVVTHFGDIAEDQYDFHGYCLRKVTLRAYLYMLKMEDELYSHEVYGEAAIAAIDCYLALHDTPPGRAEAVAEEAKLAGMNEGQRKKHAERRKKEEARKAKEAAEQLEKDRAAHNAKKNAGKFDEDPRGEKLLRTEKPLGEADKLVAVLKQHASSRLCTHRVAFEVALRQDKPFLAMHAVKHAIHLDACSPVTHTLRVRLCKWLETRLEQVSNEAAQSVLRDELSAVSGGMSAAQISSDYVKDQTGRSLAACLAGAQMLLHTDPNEERQAVALLENCDLASVSSPLRDCQAAHMWLKDSIGAPEAAQRFYDKARDVHRWSATFDGPERLEVTDDDDLVAKLKALQTTDAPRKDAQAVA